MMRKKSLKSFFILMIGLTLAFLILQYQFFARVQSFSYETFKSDIGMFSPITDEQSLEKFISNILISEKLSPYPSYDWVQESPSKYTDIGEQFTLINPNSVKKVFFDYRWPD